MILPTVTGVEVPTRRYSAQAEARHLPRTLIGGTKAMRAAGRMYLPQHPAESDGSYQLRLNSTTLYNGFEQTVTSQSAKFFAEEVQLGKDVPAELVALAKNIDGQGRALTPFMADALYEAFIDGISFILVDFPRLAPMATLADQRAIGARPYWVRLTADQIIGWRTANLNGKQVLTQVRIRELASEAGEGFSDKEVQRIRVLEPGKWAIYEYKVVEEELRWVLSESGTTSLSYIPLVPIYTNCIGYMEGAPPLRTLAELNQEHWISSSEQRRALSFLRFAMLALTGVDKTEESSVQLGPDKVLFLPAGASAEYIEHTGSGISAGAADIESIEKRMQSAGMELRIENAGRVTATVAAINSAETNAGSLAVAKALKDAIETAMQYTADVLKLASGGSVEVYEDFGSAAEVPASIADLNSARAAGNLSLPTYWNELKRRHVLSDDFDAEAELQLIDAEQLRSMELQQALFVAPQVDAQGNPIQTGGA